MTKLARIHLHDGWTVEARRGPIPPEVASVHSIPATVPGSVHTDLLAANLIPDPYLGENEKLLGWIGLTDWTYRCRFEWASDGGAHQQISFAGLDTIAEVRLNGVLLGVTRNMHRTHRFDVTSALVEGTNELTVAFSSPIKAADAASLELGYRPHTNHHPYNAIRKMACSFGWDWGIDTATSGIWRDVTLESWTGPRITSIRAAGDIVDGVPRARIVVSVDGGEGVRARVQLADVDAEAAVVDGVASFDIEVPSAELWWPRGYGAQPLYDVSVSIGTDEGSIETQRRRIGFRSVETRTDADEAGIGFVLVVNGQAVQVRGANWIPDDAFLHRVDRARYARRLDQAEFAGINLMRVWGGGIYEADAFYDECDERGILTWQDFLLACAAYAEDEPLWSEFEAEAREAIVRLGSHPSLVILNGNNENIWGHQDWDWDKRLDGRTWGAGYYYDLFPRLAGELAPHVAYTPGSPFSPDPAEHQNDPSQGTVHVWDLWNQLDWSHYRDYRPRFVAEFGWQGPPTWATLVRAIDDDPLTPESPGMLVHQKAAKGNDKLTDGLTAHVPLPNNMEDWHWAMSLNQANAVRTAIEWWRSLTPHCTGTIVWQLNDCWPVTSWAAVDGDERPKPLLYALRHAYAERLLTIQPSDAGLDVVAVNDTAVKWEGELTIERRAFDGAVLATETRTLSVAARGVARTQLEPSVSEAGDPAGELLIARLGDAVAHWFFVEARDSRLEPAELDVEVTRDGEDSVVTVIARTLTRDLSLLVDRIAPTAEADAALVTLLPGESAQIRVSGTGVIARSAITSQAVLRTLNDLVVESARSSLAQVM